MRAAMSGGGSLLGWAVALAVVVGAFGFPMVVVTAWMFDVITDGSKGFGDTMLRLFGALVAGPIVGIAAGATCAAIVGVPAFALLHKFGIDNPLRRRRRVVQSPVDLAKLPPPPPEPDFLQRPYPRPSPYRHGHPPAPPPTSPDQ